MPVPVYTAPTRSIPVKGSAEPLVVRGLGFEDITMLVQQHLPEITQAVEQYRGSLTEVYTQRSMDGFLTSLLTGFPALAAQLIAQAADDPGAAAIVGKYPVGTQMSALIAVAELTLEDAGGLTDPSPALGKALKAVLGALTNPVTTSPASIGPSDAL